jgi:hypothetical protein
MGRRLQHSLGHDSWGCTLVVSLAEELRMLAMGCCRLGSCSAYMLEACPIRHGPLA